MCFSAQADLFAGLVISGVGIDTLRHVRRPAERALAVLPMVFAGHQLVEALVWRGLEGQLQTDVWRPALWAYLVVAFVVLPVLVPVAIGALEPRSNRRRVERFTFVGAGVALVLTYALARGPVHAGIVGHHIEYSVDLWHGGLPIVGLYVVATCGSMLVSAHNHVRWFGAANLLAVSVLAFVDFTAFISLWCAWAALTSTAIAIHLRYINRPPARVLEGSH